MPLRPSTTASRPDVWLSPGHDGDDPSDHDQRPGTCGLPPRWGSLSGCVIIRTPTIETSPHRTRTRCTPRPGLMWVGNLGVEPAGRARPVLSLPDARRLDGCLPGAGKRTTGTAAQTYAITGPGWKGTLPAGVKEYKSPTAWSGCWAASTAPGPRGYTAVHQSSRTRISPVPLSSYGKPYTPPAGRGGSFAGYA